MTAAQPRADLGTASIEELAEAIKSAMPRLDASDQRIATAIYRLLSLAEPVSLQALEDEVVVTAPQIDARLDSWPGVFRDEQGRVVGFWGQAIDKLDPEYRLTVDDKTTYTWCALDTLFIPRVLGKTVRVEASDPISGQRISLLVDGMGAREVDPAGAVVSMVVPHGPFDYDVIESFCHRVLFFATEQSGAKWVAEHPGAMLLSIDDAFELGRALAGRINPGVAR